MSDINTQEMFDAKVSAFGSTANSDNWNTAFWLALKATLAVIRVKVGETVTTPTSLEDDVDLDEDYYTPVVSAGLDFYIDGHGDWMRKPEGNLLQIWREAVKDANLYYMMSVNDSDEARLTDLTD